VQRRPAKRYGLFHYASKQGVVAAPDLRPDTRRKEAPARFAGALVIKSMISAQTRSAFVARENRFPLFRIML